MACPLLRFSLRGLTCHIAGATAELEVFSPLGEKRSGERNWYLFIHPYAHLFPEEERGVGVLFPVASGLCSRPPAQRR